MTAIRRTPVETARNLQAAIGELLTREISFSTGHLAAILNGCLFAPSLFTFWFINDVVDFSTVVAIGAVASPGGLLVRLLAYALLVPVFITVRLSAYLIHPTHRRKVLAGACPKVQFLSLDWFSVGILATGLPLAIQNLGPWVTMNLVFLFGLFIAPRVLPRRHAPAVKGFTLVVGVGLFLYGNYGGALPVIPHPTTVLGPTATVRLGDETTATLMRLVNSLLVGPFIVAGFGVLMNHILTRLELQDIPMLSHALPRRDPDRIVVTSAVFGTVFYLLVVAWTTGQLTIVP